jgi:hypothetical protein
MKISAKIPAGTKKWGWLIAAVASFCPGVLKAQEVTTNAEGRKIVVDADGNWRYFQDSSYADTNQYKLPLTTAAEREKRLEATKAEAQEIGLALIRKRLEMTDLAVALQQTTDNLVYKKKQLKQLQLKITDLEKALQQVTDRLLFLEKINTLPEESYSRKLKKWDNDHPVPKPDKQAVSTVPLTTAAIVVPPKILEGILSAPPPMPCSMGELAQDPLSQETCWQNKPSHFFSHTDKGIESQLPNRNFVDCAAYLSGMEGGRKFLNLEIAVASAKAPQIFGSLPKGEFMEIVLLSGEKVTLFNSYPSNGQWVAAQDAYLYLGRFPLGIREERLLRSTETDRVLLRWSLVQEEFEVYETDFFQHQFDCLEALLSKEN